MKRKLLLILAILGLVCCLGFAAAVGFFPKTFKLPPKVLLPVAIGLAITLASLIALLITYIPAAAVGLSDNAFVTFKRRKHAPEAKVFINKEPAAFARNASATLVIYNLGECVELNIWLENCRSAKLRPWHKGSGIIVARNLEGQNVLLTSEEYQSRIVEVIGREGDDGGYQFNVDKQYLTDEWAVEFSNVFEFTRDTLSTYRLTWGVVPFGGDMKVRVEPSKQIAYSMRGDADLVAVEDDLAEFDTFVTFSGLDKFERTLTLIVSVLLGLGLALIAQGLTLVLD